MSLFKKLMPASGKNEEKRKEKLVQELHRQSGFSVAFMQEIKEKTRAIRMLRLENDEWSDDEEPDVLKKVEPKTGNKLEVVAKQMRTRKATDKQKYWNRAEKVASTKKKLHEHTKQASDSHIGKEATQLASVKASARKIIVQDRATGSVSGAKSAPASPNGSLRKAVHPDDLESLSESLASKLAAVEVSERDTTAALKKKPSKGSFSIFGHRRKVSESNIDEMIESESSLRPEAPERKRASTLRSSKQVHVNDLSLPLSSKEKKKDKDKDRLKYKEDKSLKVSKSSLDIVSDDRVTPPEPRTHDDIHKDKVDIPIRKRHKRSSAPSPDKVCVPSNFSQRSSSERLAMTTSQPSLLNDSADGEQVSTSSARALSAPVTPPEANRASTPPLGVLQPSSSDSFLPSTTSSSLLQPLSAGFIKRPLSHQRRESHAVEVSAGKTVEIIRRLGKGGTGVVWEGILQGRVVALKQITLHEMPKQKQATVRNQIKRELDLMKPFRHENVLRYFGMFYSKISQEINLVMEMVDGVSVTDIVVCQKKLPEKVAAFILHQALKGLVFLHENFIIHRDLKPDNMLIDANGVIKLIDFGCSAKFLPDEIIKRRSTVGTPWYCSPEIVNSEEYGPKCDVWSIGCTTIELVTGKPPFDDLNDVACLFKVAEGNPPSLPADVSPSCTDFLTKCLNPTQGDRPSAAELLEHPFLQLASSDWETVESDIKLLVSEMNSQRAQVENESNAQSTSK